ncbi:MAG TPA: hypothetical protein DF296_09625 [Candidatus Margulisbacteria bacterium]|nr:hypothetical protein [Candidatus Margulisiibacteriota bacterium]
MITDDEKNIIINCAKKYNVKSILLFGSAAKKNEYNDIDLAVEGIQPKLFFKFYGELFKHLDKPVDLIDLAFDDLFTEIVKEDGLKIYG